MRKMKLRVKWNKEANVMQIIKRLVMLLIILMVGTALFNGLGLIFKGTESPIYGGLSLVGWTVGSYPKVPSTNYYTNNCKGTYNTPETFSEVVTFSSQSATLSNDKCFSVTAVTAGG